MQNTLNKIFPVWKTKDLPLLSRLLTPSSSSKRTPVDVIPRPQVHYCTVQYLSKGDSFIHVFILLSSYKQRFRSHSIASATFRHYTCSQGVFQAGQHGLALWISMLLTVFDRCCGNLTAGYFTKGEKVWQQVFALRFCKRLIQPWLMTQCRPVFWGHKKSQTVGHAFVQFFLTWCLEMRQK